MRRGYQTTEFWVVLLWWTLTAIALSGVFLLPWPACLFSSSVAGVLAYFSCALSNNYGENRYLLKAGKRQQEAEANEPRGTYGFGRYVAAEQSEASEDEE